MATLTNSLCSNGTEVDIQTGIGAVAICTSSGDNVVDIATGNGTKILTLGSIYGSSAVLINQGAAGIKIPAFNITGTIVTSTTGQLINADASIDGYVLMSNGNTVSPTFRILPNSIATLAGDSGTATGSTVNVVGSGVISTSATSATLTIASTAANTINATSGSATASSNAFTIVGAGTVSTSATGSTLTITGTGGGFTWNNTTGSTQAMAVGNGYVDNGSGSPTVYTLPATAAVGNIVAVQGAGSGLWKIAQNSGQTIAFNGVTSTSGVTGSVSSTSQFDVMYVMCITANSGWAVNQSVGNLSVV